MLEKQRRDKEALLSVLSSLERESDIVSRAEFEDLRRVVRLVLERVEREPGEFDSDRISKELGYRLMPKCEKCNDTGVIETGNNGLPCDCPAGATALFNQAGVDGAVTGEEVKASFP